MEPSYQISSDQNDIVIRLPKENINQRTILKVLDFLEMTSIRERSRLTEEDVAMLSKEVKESAWQRVKHLFEEAPKTDE